MVTKISVFLFHADAFRTDWFTLHRIKRLTSHCFPTVPANKTVSMPLRIQSRHVVLHDWPVAAAAFRGKHVKVIVPTIWFAVTFMEALLAKLFAALGTEEVLCVPGLLQGCYAFIKNGPIAIGAPWREQIVVIRLAVRMSIPLEEVPGAQLLRTMSTSEVFRMPGLAEGGDNLADDRLIAGAATTLLGGVHSLTAHVGL